MAAIKGKNMAYFDITLTVDGKNCGTRKNAKVSSARSAEIICRTEYDNYLKSVKDINNCLIDEVDSEAENSFTIIATIDHCMGAENIHTVNVTVREVLE